MRVSSVQLEITDRPKEAVLRHVLDLVDQARRSDLILLPELWPCGFFAFDRYEQDAEPLDGPTVQALQAKARELKVHLVTGSIPERDGRNLYNTTLFLDPSGEILA